MSFRQRKRAYTYFTASDSFDLYRDKPVSCNIERVTTKEILKEYRREKREVEGGKTSKERGRKDEGKMKER